MYICKGKLLNVHEVEIARNVWIREIQNDAYTVTNLPTYQSRKPLVQLFVPSRNSKSIPKLQIRQQDKTF